MGGYHYWLEMMVTQLTPESRQPLEEGSSTVEEDGHLFINPRTFRLMVFEKFQNSYFYECEKEKMQLFSIYFAEKFFEKKIKKSWKICRNAGTATLEALRHHLLLGSLCPLLLNVGNQIPKKDFIHSFIKFMVNRMCEADFTVAYKLWKDCIHGVGLPSEEVLLHMFSQKSSCRMCTVRT